MNAQSPASLAADMGADAVIKAKPRNRRRLLMLSLPVALVVGAGVYWINGGRYESTDNSYFHQARLAIASDLSGRLVSVNVTDGQMVKKDAVMFTVDPEPYKLALQQANIAVDSARLQVEQLKGAYQAALAQEKVAEDDAQYQDAQFAKQQALAARGVSTGSDLDDARNTARRAEETAAVAKVAVENARIAMGGDPSIATDSHPTVAAAIAARDQAAYQLSLTEVKAPADGMVYQATSFKPGRYVNTGESLFSFMPSGQIWVEANFKETQLTHIAPGQPATVTFDGDPGHPVQGHVDAVGAGTGSEFSLIPAQNATGNWVKVTQRVPVRIVLDHPDTDAPIVSGMSASVSVDTGQTRSWSDLVPPILSGK
ncbi:HlyD family efflux transporter periplasmic adaptor subunit [bacterium]|nr:HlyD family efflux transporter periplasmic adaptor subunit [bacterium]